MNQNSIFSYAKRNNNNSEGVDGNDEQYSSNVKEALPPKRTRCNSFGKVRKKTMGRHIFEMRVLFAE